MWDIQRWCSRWTVSRSDGAYPRRKRRGIAPVPPIISRSPQPESRPCLSRDPLFTHLASPPMDASTVLKVRVILRRRDISLSRFLSTVICPLKHRCSRVAKGGGKAHTPSVECKSPESDRVTPLLNESVLHRKPGRKTLYSRKLQRIMELPSGS